MKAFELIEVITSDQADEDPFFGQVRYAAYIIDRIGFDLTSHGSRMMSAASIDQAGAIAAEMFGPKAAEVLKGLMWETISEEGYANIEYKLKTNGHRPEWAVWLDPMNLSRYRARLALDLGEAITESVYVQGKEGERIPEYTIHYDTYAQKEEVQRVLFKLTIRPTDMGKEEVDEPVTPWKTEKRTYTKWRIITDKPHVYLYKMIERRQQGDWKLTDIGYFAATDQEMALLNRTRVNQAIGEAIPQDDGRFLFGPDEVHYVQIDVHSPEQFDEVEKLIFPLKVWPQRVYQAGIRTAGTVASYLCDTDTPLCHVSIEPDFVNEYETWRIYNLIQATDAQYQELMRLKTKFAINEDEDEDHYGPERTPEERKKAQRDYARAMKAAQKMEAARSRAHYVIHEYGRCRADEKYKRQAQLMRGLLISKFGEDCVKALDALVDHYHNGEYGYRTIGDQLYPDHLGRKIFNALTSYEATSIVQSVEKMSAALPESRVLIDLMSEGNNPYPDPWGKDLNKWTDPLWDQINKISHPLRDAIRDLICGFRMHYSQGGQHTDPVFQRIMGEVEREYGSEARTMMEWFSNGVGWYNDKPDTNSITDNLHHLVKQGSQSITKMATPEFVEWFKRLVAIERVKSTIDGTLTKDE